VPQAEVKRHAITCATLNDIVQSLLDAAMARSGASGLPAIRKPFELNEVRRQRRNDVAVSGLARIPDRVS
jgi:hypothetical protein